MYRLRWTAGLIFNVKFHRSLWKTVANPLNFYAAILFNFFVPVPFMIRLYDGKVVRIATFMATYIFDEIFLQRIYDAPLPKEPETVVDIGANIGLFVLRAKQLWPNCSVLCYEPEPKNFRELERMIRLNNLTGITPVNAAVMAEPGTISLYLHPRNSGGHSTVHHHSANTITVPAETMESALSRLDGGRCNFLKVDCEGAEAPIFRALTPAIASRIDAIVYEPEWSLYSVADLNRDLTSKGFTLEQRGAVFLALR